MSAEGKPIQVPANSLQMQGVQSLSGMSHLIRNEKKVYFPRIVNKYVNR